MQSHHDSECVRNCDGLPATSTEKTETTRKNPDISEIEASPNPVPYTFRVPVPTSQACRRVTCPQSAKAPPFCLQLDHTLAVLWCLFRKKANKDTGKECQLGVGQLQWALYFLKGIKSPTGGDRAQDVTIAIQAVQDALLELYADMSNVVMQPPQPGAPFSPGSVSVYGGSALTVSHEKPCVMCEEESKKPIMVMWVPPVPSAPCNICSSVTLGTHKGEGKPRKSAPKKEDSTAPTSPIRSQVTLRKTASSGKGSTGHTSKICFSNVESVACTRDPQLSEEIKQLRMAAIELSKCVSGPPQEDSYSDQMTMLQEWRKEQVIRVQDELRRLRSLDSALGIESDVTEVNLHKCPAQNASSSFKPIASSTKRPSSR